MLPRAHLPVVRFQKEKDRIARCDSVADRAEYQNKRYRCETVARPTSPFLISAFQLFSLSAFQPFRFSAFQRFSFPAFTQKRASTFRRDRENGVRISP